MLKNSNFENIPSYKSYLNFLNQINIDEAKQFWNKTFEESDEDESEDEND